MTTDSGRVASQPGSQATPSAASASSPDGADPSRFSTPISWKEMTQRVEEFAKHYKIKPTLGLVGMMLWSIGCDYEFKLVPVAHCDSDGSGEAIETHSGSTVGDSAAPQGDRP